MLEKANGRRLTQMNADKHCGFIISVHLRSSAAISSFSGSDAGTPFHSHEDRLRAELATFPEDATRMGLHRLTQRAGYTA
jgi:hypothetical protein